jgi:hypothetical protein
MHYGYRYLRTIIRYLRLAYSAMHAAAACMNFIAATRGDHDTQSILPYAVNTTELLRLDHCNGGAAHY